jgi:demethylmenaquinone methyltransferase / 2-methoxy-6-polyprenyl-1,4-benzoquinol methylase
MKPNEEMSLTAEKVSFGYREVTPAEKKRLVQEQFDPIARTYDLADTVLSFGLDSRWRRKAVRLLGLEKGDFVLDVCGGTARLARLAAGRVGSDGRAVVYDFNLPMMLAGKGKIEPGKDTASISFIQGDAEDLSFPGGRFGAVSIGFGIRNLAHPEKGLSEFFRVLKPGGKLMILEFSLPINRLVRSLYHFYSFRWMPLIGRLICGTEEPFRYLAESIRIFPKPEMLAGLIRDSGFTDVGFRRLSNGIAVAYFGVKPLPLADSEKR